MSEEVVKECESSRYSRHPGGADVRAPRKKGEQREKLRRAAIDGKWEGGKEGGGVDGREKEGDDDFDD